MPGPVSLAGALLFAPIWDIHAAVVLRRSGHPLARLLRRTLLIFAAFVLALLGAVPLWGHLPQPGPFGFLASGLLGLRRLAGDPCCRVSRVLSPGDPVLSVIASPLSGTLALLALMLALSLIIALLIVLLLAVPRWVGRRWRRIGMLVEDILWLTLAGLAAPPGGLLLIAVLVAGVHFRLFAVQPLPLFQAALAAALLPGLMVARAVSSDEASSWRSKALAGCGALYRQAGWILCSLILVETVGGRSGVGSLLVEALRVQDAPVFIWIMMLFALALLVANTHTVWVNAFHHSGMVEPGRVAGSRNTLTRPRLVTGAAGAILLVLVIGLVGVSAKPTGPDPAHIYDQRSPDHLLGTARFGQDIQAQVAQDTRNLLAATLAGALALTALGGLWGASLAALRGWRHPVGDWLADLVRLPAQAAVLLHPALVPLLLIGSTTPMGAGVAVGLVLAPRLALSFDDRRGVSPVGADQPLRRAGALFAGALWGVLQYRYGAGMLAGSPVADGVSLMVRAFREWIAAGLAAPDGRFAWLAIAAALPGIVFGWGVFCLYVALSDQSSKPEANWLLSLLD